MKHFHVPGRPYMSMHDRAAQFMPFKSLKGYDEMVGDTADEAMSKEWVHIEFNDDVEYDPYLILDDDGDDEKYLGK